MTLNEKRRRAHQKLAALPGVRPVRRPVTPTGTEEFDLYYVRTGRKTKHPVVIVPGGPGAASIALYRGLRRRAAAAGLDVIMIEHRGIGMSRHNDAGADLPPEALTVEQVVDDVAAVLDDAQVDRAIIYGTSYGTYIAAGVGVRHPNRVHAMILDSPLLAGDDIEVVRRALRNVLWHGEEPETKDLALKVRRLVDDGVMTPTAAQLAAAVYGFGGAPLLDRQLDLLLQGRHLLWTGMGRVAELMVGRKAPYRNETDLVGRIAYRELNYAGTPDGLPLDPAVAMRDFAPGDTSFDAEPFDLVAEMPNFIWPTVVISGGRDLTTPPEVADRVAGLIPGSVLVRLATTGHSVLDSKERAALRIASVLAAGRQADLPEQAGALDAMPTRPALRLMVSAIGAAARIEAALPEVVPKLVQRATS
ncbi:alpha/beta fold hydrolase [Mycobacterium sp. CVI_P3]|uniref:Alpha/beta fold hydrolase n=1 Tax=Mycobacterium pinniadriaticum TaxID=2994102 RepID=A0ABT3SMZ0_9MYCO|nr:alpha/beta fold hydrolase [Mycobacterium pinniadriaticum]MCX2934087.1 alpha/beta fold hydrolase [Mycobacterium pinniadriaticum]MCX2940509.1 alpha/beta fold hydrolase [Mycobacterium pinniadriaticum]